MGLKKVKEESVSQELVVQFKVPGPKLKRRLPWTRVERRKILIVLLDVILSFKL
jgi:hypothetical protein